jgi:hypothetical protein
MTSVTEITAVEPDKANPVAADQEVGIEFWELMRERN